MKAFSSEVLAELNAQSSTGQLVEAMVVTPNMDNPDVKHYFIRFGRHINFEGHDYQPLDFAWEGIKTSSAMELPSNRVVIHDLGGRFSEYLEDPNVEIEGNDVLLQELFISKFGKVNKVDEMLFQVEVINGDYNKALEMHLGVDYSLNDSIPRGTIETQEFPALKEDVIRVGT